MRRSRCGPLISDCGELFRSSKNVEPLGKIVPEFEGQETFRFYGGTVSMIRTQENQWEVLVMSFVQFCPPTAFF
jgi:hypothetical protein